MTVVFDLWSTWVRQWSPIGFRVTKRRAARDDGRAVVVVWGSAFVLSVAATLLLAGGSTALAGGPPVGATYVALGDSYAAGEGLGPFEIGTDVAPTASGPNRNSLKNLCHRSQSGAYGSTQPSGQIVLPTLANAQRANWACSGARTTDMLISQGGLSINGSYYQHGQPAQTATVNSSTRFAMNTIPSATAATSQPLEHATID